MATENQAGTNTAVPSKGDHDRVVMLSLSKDGTPDQHNPEIIGDPEFAKEAARKQFSEQAVSALDAEEKAAAAGDSEEIEQDPEIAERQKAHEKAANAAEKAADKAVDSLHKG